MFYIMCYVLNNMLCLQNISLCFVMIQLHNHTKHTQKDYEVIYIYEVEIGF